MNPSDLATIEAIRLCFIRAGLDRFRTFTGGNSSFAIRLPWLLFHHQAILKHILPRKVVQQQTQTENHDYFYSQN
jgi:hypothetical protein